MSRRRNGPTRKERREKAEALLLGLLRTPKTRAGLLAAGVSEDVTKNFIFGWLSESVRGGLVTMLKSTNPVRYLATSAVVNETPSEGVFPTWLEPRALPTAIGRRVYLDGAPVTQSQGAPA